MQDFASKYSKFSCGGEDHPAWAIYMALVTRTTKILEGLDKFLLLALWTTEEVSVKPWVYRRHEK